MCIVVDRKRDECDTRFVLGTNMRRRSSEHESSSSEFLSRAQTYTIDLLLGIGGLLAQQSLQMLCNRHVAVVFFGLKGDSSQGIMECCVDWNCSTHESLLVVPPTKRAASSGTKTWRRFFAIFFVLFRGVSNSCPAGARSFCASQI